MAFAVLLPINHYSLTPLTIITPGLILILLLYFLFCPCLCPHIEREALLNFKKGVTDHSEKAIRVEVSTETQKRKLKIEEEEV